MNILYPLLCTKYTIRTKTYCNTNYINPQNENTEAAMRNKKQHKAKKHVAITKPISVFIMGRIKKS